MRTTRLTAGFLILLAFGAAALGQAGDPSFPKDTAPPAAPEKKPADNKPADKKPADKQPAEKPAEKPKDNAPERPEVPGDPRGTGGTIDLRPRFPVGRETRYVMRIKSDGTVDIAGLVPGLGADPEADKDGTKQQMEQEIGFVLRVTSGTQEEGATVEMVQERIKISIKHGSDEIFYDSTAPRRPNDDADLIEPYIKSVVGSKLTIRFDADGNVKDIQGGGELGMPGAMGRLGIPTDAKSIGSLFGPISNRTAGRGLYRVGERWTNTDQVDTGPIGSFRMVTQHTLRSAQAGSAEVIFNGRIEPGSETGKPGSPFQVKDSRYQGKYVWDTHAGQLKSMESEQEIEIAAGQGAKGGMKAKTTVTVKQEGRGR